MSRVIALVACGFTLAACSSTSLPSLGLFSPSTGTLRIESVPPGADARTLDGLTCRTPCELTVPVDVETVVSVALSGYEAHSIIVRADPATGLLTPNPILVELLPAAPPPTPKKKPPPRTARPAAPPPSRPAATTTSPATTTTQPQAQPQPQPQAPPPLGGFPPPQQQAPLPWPTGR